MNFAIISVTFFEENCAWKYLFSAEYSENIYPKITHYLVNVEISSKKTFDDIERFERISMEFR